MALFPSRSGGGRDAVRSGKSEKVPDRYLPGARVPRVAIGLRERSDWAEKSMIDKQSD
jgi:hypothetical protein